MAFANIHKQKPKHVNTHTIVRTHCARETRQIQIYAAMLSLLFYSIVVSVHHFHQYSMNRKRKRRWGTQITVYIERHSIIVFDLTQLRDPQIRWWWGGMRTTRKYSMAGQEWKKETKEARLWANYFYSIRNNFLFKSRGYRTTIFIRLMDDSFVHIFSICSLLIDNDSACVLIV